VLIAAVFGCYGCSTDDSSSSGSADRKADVQQIKDALDETIVRLRYGDKSVLYEQEFAYVKDGLTYDEYLERNEIKRMNVDTVAAFVVKDAAFLPGDSALVDVDVVFVGPLGDTTHFPQTWHMYRYNDRWIRPTLSTREGQDYWDERRRVADSAAEAEKGLGKDDW